jgi:hypothetical protein
METIQKGFESDLGLEPGKGSPQAKMNAGSESKVRGAFSTDIKLLRLVEATLVVICAPQENHDEFAFFYGLSG